MLAAWLLFPAILLAMSLGCGLLVDRVARVDLPGVLLVPTGFALVLVVSRLFTEKEFTTGLALPLLIVLAVAGAVAGWGRLRRPSIDLWATAAAVGVFAVLGAPVFLSGDPTIAGSIVLPDTAGHLAVASFVADHGHAWQQLEPSSYRTLLRTFLHSSYPVAGQSALGVLAPLGGIDLAWLYQPLLTFAACLLPLSAYALLEPLIESRPWRGLAAFIAAQPALIVGFALQGSIKEVTAAGLIALSGALAARARTEGSAGALLPFVLALAAALGVLGTPAAAYVAPFVIWIAVVWGRRLMRTGSRRQLIGVGVAVLFGLAVALPVVLGAGTSFRVTKKLLADRAGLGNLPSPLPVREIAGIWLNGDYRYPRGGSDLLNWALIVLMFAAAAVGVAWMIRRRAIAPLLLVVALVGVGIPLALEGNPYADAKVFAIASPAVVLAAAVGVWALRGVARGLPALALAALLAGGVLVSTALAYHDSRHAPYHRYSELIRIDDRFAGQGPALEPDYDEYGAYFLRKLRIRQEPNAVLLYREPPLPTELNQRPNRKAAADLEALKVHYVETFPLLVLRRSPVTSRPPLNYHRVFHGRYYDVWRRARGPFVRDHISLGDGMLQPAGVMPCRSVLAFGRLAAGLKGGRLAYVELPRLPELLPLDSRHPFYWHGYPGWPGSVVPVGQGDIENTVSVPRAGRYAIWVEGSFGRAFTAYVDGRRVGSVANEEGYPGGHVLLGSVDLPAGRHQVRLFSGGGDLRPGNGGSDSSLRHVGPVVLSPLANERRQVRVLAPARARELCGRRLDWLEVVY